MNQFSYTLSEDNSIARLVVEKQSPDCANVFYTPSGRVIEQLFPGDYSAKRHRAKILTIDRKNRCLTIFPINTKSDYHDFLDPKYRQIERITIMDQEYEFYEFDSLAEDEVIMMLESLPPGFAKDYEYGLGLTRPCRFIVMAVESLSDCTEIVVSRHRMTEVDEEEKIFYISTNDFETVRKSINRTIDTSQIAARSVNSGVIHNFFSEKLGKNPVLIQTGRSPLRKRFTDLMLKDEYPLSRDEQDIVMNVLAENTRAIAETNPDKLAILQRDIDLVTLDTLIERYDGMIKGKFPEERWQVFFSENPFILSLAFGYPVIKVRGQASVGGRKLSGTGEKIIDFLIKNRVVAQFEIRLA